MSLARKGKLIGSNSRFNVWFEPVNDKYGNKVKDYLIVDPVLKNEQEVAGVAILPIVDEKIGLIEIYRPALDKTFLEIPHGFVEENESNQKSAIRELLEETGVNCQTISSLGLLTPDSGIIGARVELFVAIGRMGTQQVGCELGIEGMHLFERKEIEEMIISGVIQDSFTLAALLKLILKDQADE